MFEQMEQRRLASQKLRQMWQGNLVIMISVIFMVVMVVIMLMSVMTNPLAMYVGGGLEFTLVMTLLSTLAMTVGMIIYLVGLYGLRNVQPEYRTAFQCWLVSFVLNLISSLVGEESLISSALDLAGTVLNLVARLPGLHTLNRTGGAILGLLKGCAVLFLCAWVLRYLGSVIPEETVEQTHLLKFFMTTNPFTLLGGL